VQAAKIYSKELAGKHFLYIFSNQYIEVVFPTDHFLHLTGVHTTISAKSFYSNAKKGKLTDRQFGFSDRYPFQNAKKKIPCLIRLPELTTKMVCVLRDMSTISLVYKLSITNLEFTLGLSEGTLNTNGRKLFYPVSLRVKDSAVERSSGGEIVDFVLSKDASFSKYNNILVQDPSKKIPEDIRSLIDCKCIDNSDII